MQYSAVLFLLAGLIAVGLELAGVVAVPRQIAWSIFLAGAVLLAIQVVRLGVGRIVRVR